MGFIEGTACVKNVSSGFSLLGSNVANPSTFFTVSEGQFQFVELHQTYWMAMVIKICNKSL